MKNIKLITLFFLIVSCQPKYEEKIEYTELEKKVISKMNDVELLLFENCLHDFSKDSCFRRYSESLKEKCVQQSSGSNLAPLAIGAAAGYLLAPRRK